MSPDPGRALITGVTQAQDPTLEHVNAFKISPLRGIRRTAPYFHDNSAKTLEDVATHYTLFFQIVTGGVISLTPQDAGGYGGVYEAFELILKLLISDC